MARGLGHWAIMTPLRPIPRPYHKKQSLTYKYIIHLLIYQINLIYEYPFIRLSLFVDDTMSLGFDCLCVICHRRPISAMFFPCRHLICCWPCAQGLTICPSCLSQIQNMQRFNVNAQNAQMG